jgi:hypothetical protein
MTNQAEKIHIIEISRIIIDRLKYINIKPHNILTYNVQEEIVKRGELKKLYPNAVFDKSIPVDFIMAVFTSDAPDMPERLKDFQKKLAPGGLFMFGGLNLNFVLQDIGDFLLALGFVDVVMDKELLSPDDEVIYGLSWMPRPSVPVKIPLSQISRKQ